VKSNSLIKKLLSFSVVGIMLITGLLASALHQIFSHAALSDSNSYYVAPSGDDNNPGTESQPWATIQKACDTVSPGSTVYVKAGTYHEKISVEVSGTADGGYVTIRNYGNDKVIIDGTGIEDSNIIYIENKDYLKIMGFEICNNTGVSDGSGIRIEGSGEHIEISNNKIYEIRGSDAMGITVYGTDAAKSISHLKVDGNQIYNCDPAHSEALTLNGNVDNFEVTNNIVRDVNNISIDFIGGEGMCPDDAKDAARNGMCRGNLVYNAHSSYGGGYAAGIYIDGGNHITVERNIVYNCDVGIEVGCEIGGKVAYDNLVRDNFVFNNDKRGIGFGGYEYPTTGKVLNCKFFNNSCFNNDTMGTGSGELYIEYAEGCEVENNIFYCSSQNRLLVVSAVNSNNIITLDYNLWFANAGAESVTIDWRGEVYEGYSAYISGSGQDTHSQFDDPQFVSNAPVNPDLHIITGSPAIDNGDPAFVPDPEELDIDGGARVHGSRVDIGADEYGDTSQTTTTTIEEETCFIEEVYGTHSETTALLRNLRDDVLLKTPEGQEMIRMYYEWSPVVLKMMEEDKDFRKSVISLFDAMLHLMVL
jgi:hypothetical protein